MEEMPKAPGTNGKFIGTTAGQGSVPLLAGGLPENPPGFTFRTAWPLFLHFVREPDCWGTDYPSPLHRLFQFVTFGEGLRRRGSL